MLCLTTTAALPVAYDSNELAVPPDRKSGREGEQQGHMVASTPLKEEEEEERDSPGNFRSVVRSSPPFASCSSAWKPLFVTDLSCPCLATVGLPTTNFWPWLRPASHGSVSKHTINGKNVPAREEKKERHAEALGGRVPQRSASAPDSRAAPPACDLICLRVLPRGRVRAP